MAFLPVPKNVVTVQKPFTFVQYGCKIVFLRMYADFEGLRSLRQTGCNSSFTILNSSLIINATRLQID